MIVIDASIAIKLINTHEDGGDKAAELLKNHIAGEDEIIIPHFLYLEVANALTTKSNIIETQIQEGIDSLYDAKFVHFDVGKDDIEDASILAKQYKTSVYDMLYAVIAKKKGITLITADEKFVKKVNLPFVKLL